MKKIILILLVCFNAINVMAQETLQSVTDRGRVIIGDSEQIAFRKLTEAGGAYFRFRDELGTNRGYIGMFASTNDLVIDPNNANLLVTSGNVMIGAGTPLAKLDVNGDVHNFNSTQDNRLILSTTVTPNGSIIQGANAANSAVKDILLQTSGGNVGIGTTSPSEKLSVNGKIRSKEIKVELAGWSDFVFAKDYKLPTLQETEKHIQENGHLSGIPSAAEVKANGIDLGEMNAKLLQKIEELTLYLIEMKKENTIQNDKHNKEIEFLKSKLR